MMAPRGLRRAVEALERPGGVVLYPTETLYGLGGRATDPRSAQRIAALKGRPPGGLIVLATAPPLDQPVARALAAAFWPGPLTLVVPGWPGLPPAVLGPDGTVAVRPPLHPAAVALVAALGPITSTSANRSGEPPLLDPADLQLEVDAVIDVGVLPESPPSTIVRGDSGAVLRAGALPVERVRELLRSLGS